MTGTRDAAGATIMRDNGESHAAEALRRVENEAGYYSIFFAGFISAMPAKAVGRFLSSLPRPPDVPMHESCVYCA